MASIDGVDLRPTLVMLAIDALEKLYTRWCCSDRMNRQDLPRVDRGLQKGVTSASSNVAFVSLPLDEGRI